MSQPVDKILEGCKDDLDMHYPEGNSLCGGKCYGCEDIHYCPSCKSKMQGMIEILEDELKFLQENEIEIGLSYGDEITTAITPLWLSNRIEEIQSDLTKLKEGLK